MRGMLTPVAGDCVLPQPSSYFQFEDAGPNGFETTSPTIGNVGLVQYWNPSLANVPQSVAGAYAGTQAADFDNNSLKFLTTKSVNGPETDVTFGRFTGATSFTIAVRIKPTTLRNQVFAAVHTSTTDLQWTLISFANGLLQFRVSTDGSTSLNATTGNKVIVPGTWHWLVGSFNAATGTVNCWIDGERTGSYSAPTDASYIGNLFQSATAYLRIGKGRSDACDCAISDFLIYESAFDDCIVKKLAAKTGSVV